MIYSTLHNKYTNEDPKTSVVFENLMLLPDNVFWDILKTAAANKNILPENAGKLYNNFWFWPKWDPNSKYDTGNSNYVEPDVFFRFENIDVIVEAKYSDNIGQYRGEWEREFKAYLNMYEDDGKEVVLLAVGGNPTYETEREMKVGEHKCMIVKYSWANLINAVLNFEKKELGNITNENQSSMARIVQNVRNGFHNMGIYEYNKKMELQGLRNLFTLGIAFQQAIKQETETESYSLSAPSKDFHESYYGYKFEITPKDQNKPKIWLTIALWINNQELICIQARNNESCAKVFCKQIEDGKGFISKYAEQPYPEEDCYYFEVNDKFNKDFSAADTFDAQVDLLKEFIDEICQYYLK